MFELEVDENLLLCVTLIFPIIDIVCGALTELVHGKMDGDTEENGGMEWRMEEGRKRIQTVTSAMKVNGLMMNRFVKLDKQVSIFRIGVICIRLHVFVLCSIIGYQWLE